MANETPPLMLSPAEQASWCNVALKAATASKALLVERFGGGNLPRSQVGRDIKLEEDRFSERLIVAALRENSAFPILSEESGWIGDESPDGYYWAVDPLDGSFNYNRGVPLCATAVALCHARQPLLGVVFDFLRDESFCGGPQLGLQINGSAVKPPPSERQILATGLPVRGDFSAAGLNRLVDHAREWKKIRMIGSAALSLAWVAAGRFDGYAENGIMWWDVAAGLALTAAVGVSGSAEGSGSLLEPFDVAVQRNAASQGAGIA